MSFRTILYAYIIGGFTLIPLLLCALVGYAIYTSEPVAEGAKENVVTVGEETEMDVLDVQDTPKTRKSWLTVRRTFEESTFDGGYVTLVRSFLDARSKDPKRSRPKDMWYVVLKGQILYLYEDEAMTECEAAIQLGSHDVVVYPEGLLDGELFTKRNAICLKPKQNVVAMPSLTKEMKLNDGEEEKLKEGERKVAQVQAAAREQALSSQTPWFVFVRSTVEMEEWYFALVHASQHPAQTHTLDSLQDVFLPSDMNLLVSTLDEQPDIIPMRWFNALFGRIFYSFYRTEHLESFIIGRLMKKLSKVKRPTFLNDILVTEVSVGNRTPVFSKPMLKELTKEGDASIEVHLAFKGEIRITVQATATINLGARFKPYTVKLVLAAVLRELEGNLLIKVKRPPSNRIWYAFTQMPRMVLNVEPVVSDRQITWSMILSTIESSLKTIIQESIVMPNMDDIAFFETVNRGGTNRGGIWADTARKRGNVQVQVQEESVSSDLGLAQESLSDAPVSSPDPAFQPIQKSVQGTSSSTLEPPPSAPSINMPEDSSSPPSNRRKTWFSTVRATDTSALPGDFSDDNVELESRGRTWDVDTQKSPTLRSQSTPKSGTLDKNADDDENILSSLVPPLKQRSASQSSSIRESEPAVSDSSRTNDKSSPAVPAPANNTPPSPTNFLTTLKSRAGDKQALSNSAKEAMRKWGMKWGNMNKDSSSSSSQSHNEDIPDHDTVGEGSGLVHSRSRTMSAMNGLPGSQKSRASYAEVRAAVAERKERSEHEPSPSGNPSSAPSAPIAIPSHVRTNSQSGASPSPYMNGSLSTSSGHSASASSYPNQPIPEVNDGEVHSQSQRMTVSVSESSSSSSSSTKSFGASDGTKLSKRSHTTPDLPVEEAAPLHSPIHVQPQSKTMSIPGIHASHRGDVMSMGYVAPQEDKEKEKQRNRTSSQGSSALSNLGSLGTTSMGSLSRNPKIQSMYRLWKQASSKEDQDGSFQSSNEEDPRHATVSSTTLSPPPPQDTSPALPASMSSLSKRAPPPPLPPRPSPVTITPSSSRLPPPLPPRTPSSASRASTSGSPTSSVVHQSPNLSVQNVMPSPPVLSSAQDVLKEIATKDDHTRKRASLSLPSVSGSPPSPTTGRRTSTAASARPPSPTQVPPFSLNDPAAAAREDTSTEEALGSSKSEIDATRAWGLDDDGLVETEVMA
ncbi:hypothetical protein BDP27DRAFT_1316351 [Rhodocollybia butyracea]|uniref:SMP-LTD domain-containing protein n=1 Tax=Rhodocollybia butyracea TaxID=206335 RepID=A0A9P5Q3Z0_9AGAR|nr:hypothetical protein BDP27DRAFT_1316351 [Rhodocollybia butyracea]